MWDLDSFQNRGPKTPMQDTTRSCQVLIPIQPMPFLYREPTTPWYRPVENQVATVVKNRITFCVPVPIK